MFHPRIIRELEDKLARPLAHIFHNSVETGIMPVDWKSANVTAIHKKENWQEPGHYRPIILTSVVCKTMEILVNWSLITHLEMNNLIGDSQHSFRYKRSRMTSLGRIFDTCVAVS